MSADGDEDMQTMPEPDMKGFEALLDYLRRSRGFDFSGYKPSSLMRRVHRRMATIGQSSFIPYTDYLEVHPEEFALLFNTILINVTGFFRDPSAWEFLTKEVVPKLVRTENPGKPIRIWSAGCASGEEAFTLAMVLAEALGADGFRERVKIYATDIDDTALSRARLAVYDAKEVENLPTELRDRYFEKVNHRYAFLKEYRRSVIFGRHDLLQDAPISRIDLLVCRNTLMYFNSEAQNRILERFHFALTDQGYLFLGKAETLLTYSSTFAPVDLKRRIFAKIPKSNYRDRLLTLAREGNGEAYNHLVNHVRIRETVFETVPIAQFVIDQNGFMILANEKARTMFHLALTDLGRPLQDLELSYKPVELRSTIERALTERQPVTIRDVEWPTESAPGTAVNQFDVQVFPLLNGPGPPLGTSVTFTDVTGYRKLQADLVAANRELEAAYEELQSTNEELETTNEELQSTIEELETTNEELEGMNEELQSTNEELQTLNEELHERGIELNEVNGYLESILRSMRGAVVVVNRDLVVQIWNHRAEDLWGLRPEEVVGKPFLNLDLSLPLEQLKPSLKSSLAGETEHSEASLPATNRRGKAITCQITCTPLRDAANVVKGSILLMSEQDT